MSERLLRFTRNDNMQCTIKVHGRCHCEHLFRSNLPAFIKEIWLRLCRAMEYAGTGHILEDASAVKPGGDKLVEYTEGACLLPVDRSGKRISFSS